MEVFTDIDDLWWYTLSSLIDIGQEDESRDGKVSAELISHTVCLSNPAYNTLVNPVRNASRLYSAAEFIWYLSGRNTPEIITHYAPSYSRFVERGTINGAYGHRWGVHSQIERVARELQENPLSRRAVMTCWSVFDLYKDSVDIPCTLSLQFLIRDGGLILITTMRSNDVWLGMPYDIYCFTTLQKIIADMLGVRVGCYIHQVGSLHLYQRNYEKALLALARRNESPAVRSQETGIISIEQGLRVIDEVVEYERLLRTQENYTCEMEGPTIFTDMLDLIANNNGGSLQCK